MRDYTYEIALTLLPGIGSHSARQLLGIVDSAETLFGLPAAELRHIFGKHTGIIEAIAGRTTLNEAEAEMRFAEKNHVTIHYYTEPGFPQRLNRPGCEDAPILVYTLGDADLNPPRAVSIVGTRRATDYGRDMTRRLVDGLRGEGITVVSGLALGIDAASHEAALQNALPTVGVLAHGLDRLYPPQNRQLAKRILGAGGALVTEMRSHTPLAPGLFPARNRIIAALADATVVVEASHKGGALITANLANGYHRDLFAVPGRIGDKYSEGCNAIIASCKATMIRNADDLLANMGWERQSRHEGRQTTLFPKLEGDEKTVFQILTDHPGIGMEDIRTFCDLSLPKIATALLGLELKNCCRCLPGKVYKPL